MQQRFLETCLCVNCLLKIGSWTPKPSNHWFQTLSLQKGASVDVRERPRPFFTGKDVAPLQLRMGEVEVLLGQGKVRVAKLQESHVVDGNFKGLAKGWV